MLTSGHDVHDRPTALAAKIILCGAVLGATLWACTPDPCPSLALCYPHYDMSSGCADGGTDAGCSQTTTR